LLGAEEAEEVRLRDAGRRGDLLGRGAMQPAARKQGHRRLEHRLAALLSSLPFRSRGRHGSEYSLTSAICQVRLALDMETRAIASSISRVGGSTPDGRSLGR